MDANSRRWPAFSNSAVRHSDPVGCEFSSNLMYKVTTHSARKIPQGTLLSMIPAYTHSGVLPPYVGTGPQLAAGMAPYVASASEFVARFATTPERIALLRGFLAMRQAIAGLGIRDGFQWVNGSFVEDVESLRIQPPGDIDLVTFARRPVNAGSDAAWRGIWSANPTLFVPSAAKNQFGCEAFFVDLTQKAEIIVRALSLLVRSILPSAWVRNMERACINPLVSDDHVAIQLL